MKLSGYIFVGAIVYVANWDPDPDFAHGKIA